MTRYQPRAARARASMLAVALMTVGASSAAAQATGTTPHATHPAASSTDLQQQIADLRAQVAKLQAALDQSKAGGATAPAMGMQQKDNAMGGGMSMMGKGRMGMGMPPQGMKKGGMMEGMDKMPMDKMPMDQKEMAGMMKGEMGGMKSMGAAAPDSAPMQMGAAAAMTAPSKPVARTVVPALPGYPAMAHLYHIGGSGFFLDQPAIELSPAQEAALTAIRERWTLARADADRRIDEADEALWALTGAAQPDGARVNAKVQEIERLRASARLDFIRAVGEATKVLSPAQRKVLAESYVPQK